MNLIYRLRLISLLFYVGIVHQICAMKQVDENQKIIIYFKDSNHASHGGHYERDVLMQSLTMKEMIEESPNNKISPALFLTDEFAQKTKVVALNSIITASDFERVYGLMNLMHRGEDPFKDYSFSTLCKEYRVIDLLGVSCLQNQLAKVISQKIDAAPKLSVISGPLVGVCSRNQMVQEAFSLLKKSTIDQILGLTRTVDPVLVAEKRDSLYNFAGNVRFKETDNGIVCFVICQNHSRNSTLTQNIGTFQADQIKENIIVSPSGNYVLSKMGTYGANLFDCNYSDVHSRMINNIIWEKDKVAPRFSRDGTRLLVMQYANNHLHSDSDENNNQPTVFSMINTATGEIVGESFLSTDLREIFLYGENMLFACLGNGEHSRIKLIDKDGVCRYTNENVCDVKFNVSQDFLAVRKRFSHDGATIDSGVKNEIRIDIVNTKTGTLDASLGDNNNTWYGFNPQNDHELILLESGLFRKFDLEKKHYSKFERVNNFDLDFSYTDISYQPQLSKTGYVLYRGKNGNLCVLDMQQNRTISNVGRGSFLINPVQSDIFYVLDENQKLIASRSQTASFNENSRVASIFDFGTAYKYKVKSLAVKDFSADGKLLLLQCHGGYALINAITRTLIQYWEKDDQFLKVAFDEDQKNIIVTNTKKEQTVFVPSYDRLLIEAKAQAEADLLVPKKRPNIQLPSQSWRSWLAKWSIPVSFGTVLILGLLSYYKKINLFNFAR